MTTWSTSGQSASSAAVERHRDPAALPDADALPPRRDGRGRLQFVAASARCQRHPSCRPPRRHRECSVGGSGQRVRRLSVGVVGAEGRVARLHLGH